MGNTKFISPARFYDAFLEVVTEHDDELADAWYRYTIYTKLMLGTVLDKVAEQLDLKSWSREYYSLDSVFYRELDTVNFPKGIENAKYIEVALEHEHVLSGTAQEINKLQLFHAPLKVLITYDDNDNQRTEFLGKYASIIKAADIFGDCEVRQPQLVIFGRKSESETNIRWSAYLYGSSGFKALSWDAVNPGK